jgi:hypothetical protein
MKENEPVWLIDLRKEYRVALVPMDTELKRLNDDLDFADGGMDAADNIIKMAEKQEQQWNEKQKWLDEKQKYLIRSIYIRKLIKNKIDDNLKLKTSPKVDYSSLR